MGHKQKFWQRGRERSTVRDAVKAGLHKKCKHAVLTGNDRVDPRRQNSRIAAFMFKLLPEQQSNVILSLYFLRQSGT